MLNIGFAQLSDCAPIVVAKQRGVFEANGLNVNLTRFASWAAMRDALGTGTIDAAHMLSPMVIASAAGIAPFAGDFTTALVLNLNGNAITVSNGLLQAVERASPEHMLRLPFSSAALKPVIAARRENGDQPLVFAHVFPNSMHAYQLRYWLSAGGIDPDLDVQLVVIPPEQMVQALASGDIDGFCVGEPWNNHAVISGTGRTLITSSEIWPSSPEKVLAVRREWADKHSKTHAALVSSILETCRWLDRPSNRLAAAQLVSHPNYVNIPYDEVVSSLTGQNRQTAGRLRLNLPDFNVFYRYSTNFPWISHAKWILAQMVRWGELPASIDFDEIAARAFLPDFYRAVAGEMDIPYPTTNQKVEGASSFSRVLEDASRPIALRPDKFIDGRIFDPDDIDGYLNSFR